MTEPLTLSPSTSSTPNDYQAAKMISGDSSDEPDTMLKFSTREHLTVPVSSSTSSAPTHHQAAEIIVISSGEDDEITIVPNAAPEPRTMKQEKGSDDEKDTRRQATVSKKSDDDLLPRAKQSKFGPQFWDDVKVESVDSTPNDINGRKVYEVKSSRSAKLSAVRDGRNWKKDSGTQGVEFRNDHTCPPKPVVQKPVREIKRQLTENPQLTPSTIQSNLIVSQMRQGKDWNSVEETARNIMDKKWLSNQKQKIKDSNQPHGHNFEV
ncbi:Hypothetical predicted protein [Paramuricea clavata]|uniref:Uncharacterized protein n=1 Tax=Paramuricea clavata TaxID=317549 RepID=A0A7D9EK15_PARCT|nr:Hypothetical predicted protein [Paramuricea clavata]